MAKAKATQKDRVPVNRLASSKNGSPLVPEKLASDQVRVTPLDEKIVQFRLIGTAPYMQCRFPEKAIKKMAEKQQAGSQAASKRTREPRDFEADYEAATHFMADGRCGIPATAFRNAMISACRVAGFVMTKAKLSLFIVADGYDKIDGTPLVLIEGEREMSVMAGRNANGGTDLRSRPMWREWTCLLKVRFDQGQFSVSDVFNLLYRVGRQVGVGAGRPDSSDSNGLGLGLFDIELIDE